MEATDSLVEAPRRDVEPPADHCLNCGARVDGRFCAACGQAVQPLRQPVHRIVSDAFTEFFGVDGRFWRSVMLLLFRPGRLTTEYVAGRRSRYVRPLRLYLITSLSFFFLVTLLDPIGRANPIRMATVPTEARPVEQRLTEIDGELERIASTRERYPERAEAAVLFQRLDSLAARLAAERAAIAALPAEQLVTPAAPDIVYNIVTEYAPVASLQIGLADWIPRSPAVRRVEQARTVPEATDAIAELARSTIARFASMMFLMLPLFAGLLKLAYVRRDWYYSEHLVFALHVHAFAFAVLGACLLLAIFVPGPVAFFGINALLLVVVVYFLVAQRRVYRQSVIKGLLKSGVVGYVYVLLLSVGVFAALAVAAAIG